MQTIANYQDPVTGTEFTFALIPRHDLRNSPYQRDYSSTLVNRLVNSVSFGFINPIVVTPSDGGYQVIDGQHRLGAMDKVLTEDNPLVPCIITPVFYRDLPLFYNIEKTDNVKDKAAKLYKLYTAKTTLGGFTEFDLSPSANHEPYLFTIAFCHMEHGLSSPSMIEGPVKKVDNKIIYTTNEDGYRTAMGLSEAIDLRRDRAAHTKRLAEIVEETAMEYGVSDFNLKKSIVSQASRELWGNKRKIEEAPEEAIPALTEQITMMDWSWMAGR